MEFKQNYVGFVPVTKAIDPYILAVVAAAQGFLLWGNRKRDRSFPNSSLHCMGSLVGVVLTRFDF